MIATTVNNIVTPAEVPRPGAALSVLLDVICSLLLSVVGDVVVRGFNCRSTTVSLSLNQLVLLPTQLLSLDTASHTVVAVTPPATFFNLSGSLMTENSQS